MPQTRVCQVLADLHEPLPPIAFVGDPQMDQAVIIGYVLMVPLALLGSTLPVTSHDERVLVLDRSWSQLTSCVVKRVGYVRCAFGTYAFHIHEVTSLRHPDANKEPIGSPEGRVVFTPEVPRKYVDVLVEFLAQRGLPGVLLGPACTRELEPPVRRRLDELDGLLCVCLALRDQRVVVVCSLERCETDVPTVRIHGSGVNPVHEHGKLPPARHLVANLIPQPSQLAHCDCPFRKRLLEIL